MHKTLLCLIPWAVCSLSAQEAECIPPPKPERIGVSQTEGKGLGYAEGYTSLDLFLSQPFCHSGLVPFLDVRGRRFNNGKYAANAGLGLRWLNACASQVWGINGFYDYEDTKHGHYNQAALGLEFFSERWEAHLNGYLPVGRKRDSALSLFLPGCFPRRLFTKRDRAVCDERHGRRGGLPCLRCEMFRSLCRRGAYYYGGARRPYAMFSAMGIGRRRAGVCALLLPIGTTFLWRASRRTTPCSNGAASSRFLSRSLLISPGSAGRAAGPTACKTGCISRRLRNEIMVIDRIDRYSTNPNVLDPNNEP